MRRMGQMENLHRFLTAFLIESAERTYRLRRGFKDRSLITVPLNHGNPIEFRQVIEDYIDIAIELADMIRGQFDGHCSGLAQCPLAACDNKGLRALYVDLGRQPSRVNGNKVIQRSRCYFDDYALTFPGYDTVISWVAISGQTEFQSGTPVV